MKNGTASDSIPSGFADLPPDQQRRIKDGGEQIVKFAYGHAFPITVSPPPSAGRLDLFRNGSGFFARIGGKLYLGTADHVLSHYFLIKQNPEGAVIQAASFRFYPEERRAWRDAANDIALIEVTEQEAASVGVMIVDPPTGWPPPEPKPGSFVCFSGFPAVVRKHTSEKRTHFNALSSLMKVTTTGNGYLVCQFEREEWVNFSPPEPPPPGTDLGGMSGGPVFLLQSLAFPLVGLISEFSTDFELLYVKTLAHVPSPVPAVADSPA